MKVFRIKFSIRFLDGATGSTLLTVQFIKIYFLMNQDYPLSGSLQIVPFFYHTTLDLTHFERLIFKFLINLDQTWWNEFEQRLQRIYRYEQKCITNFEKQNNSVDFESTRPILRSSSCIGKAFRPGLTIWPLRSKWLIWYITLIHHIRSNIIWYDDQFE